MHWSRLGFNQKRVLPEPLPPTIRTFCSAPFRVFGAAIHRQPLRLRENDVVLKCGIDIGLDVLGGSPTGAAVLQIFAEFLGIFALDIDRQSNGDGGGNAHAQVNGMKAGDKGVERRVQAGHNVQQLRRSVRTGSQPHRLADLGGQQRDEHIRNIGKDELLTLTCFIVPAPSALSCPPQPPE